MLADAYNSLGNLSYVGRFRISKIVNDQLIYLIFYIYRVVQMGTQLIIWSMTFYKSIVLFFQHGWMKIPVLSLVTRDGLWVFVLFTGWCTS